MQIYEYREYLQKRYGEVLHRVPLDGGFNCPHRTVNKLGGCSFCSENGARAVQLGDLIGIEEQVRAGVAFARKRYKARAFMAYLQAFTSTLSSPAYLRELVQKICSLQNFRALSIGTRPDCLPERVIDLLRELQKDLDIWVELGVQTSNDETLQRINRGHNWQTSREAISRLHDAGISTAVHLIIGLPGETLKDYRSTLLALSRLPVAAIKLHNLHIINGTALSRSYAEQPFHLYSEHEYAEILLELLQYIPDNRPIIRLTTDTPEELLRAPLWTMNKAQFRTYLLNQMQKRGIRQGMALQKAKMPRSSSSEQDTILEPVQTEDGSLTYWNMEYKEHYHTPAGARTEAERKYCLPGDVAKRCTQGPVRILDICFGLGYNSLISCEHALAVGGHLEITALEIDKRVVIDAAERINEVASSFDWNSCLQELSTRDLWQHEKCGIQLFWGDARYTLSMVRGPFDLIWLDAFSTQRNSELWTVDFFKRLYPLLKENGALLTYCAAIPVRAALLSAGFEVGETTPFGRERGGTMAARNRALLPRPLPERDLQLMDSPRGTPYRDPEGLRSNKEILRYREFEIVERKRKAAEEAIGR